MSLDEKWIKTMKDAKSGNLGNEYDPVISQEVNAYKLRLGKTPSFPQLTEKFFKAMAWVETGPFSDKWKTRPMQIGNPGDPGLAHLRDQTKPGPQVILTEQLKNDIKGDINEPKLNVRAGIAYALVRLVTAKFLSVNDTTDTAIYTYTVVAGDSLEKIAARPAVSSTVASLIEMNPGLKPNALQIKQTLKYRKAKMTWVITNWMSLTAQNVAQSYNTGDADYEAKLKCVINNIL